MIDIMALPWPLGNLLGQSVVLEQHVLGTVEQMAAVRYPPVPEQ